MLSSTLRQQAPVLLLEDSIPRSLLYVHHMRQAGIPVVHALWSERLGELTQYNTLVLSLLDSHVTNAAKLLERASAHVPALVLGEGPLPHALQHTSNVVAYIDRTTTVPQVLINSLLQIHITHK